MKPFLKWAGNKYQIIAQIQAALPAGKRLIEPFAGSAAVFLNTNFSNYVLADVNADLINVFNTLKAEGAAFIHDCHLFFSPENNSKEQFYHWRQQFNTTTDKRLKAILFIYLNKHCFNGLCRYNTKGQFNTPFGRYAQPYFPQREMQYFYEKAQTAVFQTADFVTTLSAAEKGDVVYCDPPYLPLSATAKFTHYSAAGFDLTQQEQLAAMAEQLASQGIPVMISNHHTPLAEHLYQNAKLLSLDVQRFISCQGAKRTKAKEILAIFD